MIDGMDTKYPLSVEYGDFGKASYLNTASQCFNNR